MAFLTKWDPFQGFPTTSLMNDFWRDFFPAAQAARTSTAEWSPRIDLRAGIERTYRDFLREYAEGLLRE